MRTVAILACLVVVAMAFAGCSNKGKDDDKTSSSSSSSHSSSSASSTSKSSTRSSTGSSSQTSTGSAPNHAPTGGISASVNGTNATFTLTGTDADDDTLVWDLTFGDGNSTNGTTLPAMVNHTYNGTGNFTANFTITDGKDPVAYNVTAAIGGVGGAVTETVQAAWDGPDNVACAGAPYDTVPGTEGLTYVTFAVEPGTWGRAFTAEFASFSLQDHLLFVDSAGGELDSFQAGLPSTSWTVTGDVPADAALGVFYGCGAAQGEEVTYTAGP